MQNLIIFLSLFLNVCLYGQDSDSSYRYDINEDGIKVYHFCDELAEYGDNNEQLFQKIFNELNFNMTKDCWYAKIHVKILVSKSGDASVHSIFIPSPQCNDTGVVKQYETNLKNSLDKILKDLGKWNPGIIDNERVASYVVFPIKLHPEF